MNAGVVSVAQTQTQTQPSPVAPQSQPVQPPSPITEVPTTQGPLPGAVRPKTEAQFDADQRERDDRAALSDQIVLLAALLVAVGAFLAIAFTVQVFYLGLGLRAMRKSSQQAERNIMVTQRAFVYLNELTWKAAGDNVKLSPIWANAGTTPTRRLRISTNWKASHGELRPDFDISYARPPETLFLGPGAKAEIGAMFVPMREIQAAIEGRLHLYVWGRATYEDIFEGTAAHFFDFCYRLEVSGDTPGNIDVRFAQFGLSNGSDEDSRQPAEAS